MWRVLLFLYFFAFIRLGRFLLNLEQLLSLPALSLHQTPLSSCERATRPPPPSLPIEMSHDQRETNRASVCPLSVLNVGSLVGIRQTAVSTLA